MKKKGNGSSIINFGKWIIFRKKNLNNICQNEYQMVKELNDKDKTKGKKTPIIDY